MIIAKLKKLNFLFIFIIILLSIIGVFALYSAANGNFDPWAKKLIIRFSLAFIVLVIIALMDIRIFYKHAYTIFFLCLLNIVLKKGISTILFKENKFALIPSSIS